MHTGLSAYNAAHAQEDELVIKLVKEYGDKSWVVVAPFVTTRCVGVCVCECVYE